VNFWAHVRAKPAAKMAAATKMIRETEANYQSMVTSGHLVSKLYDFGTNKEYAFDTDIKYAICLTWRV
jgi:hypothetical protein